MSKFSQSFATSTFVCSHLTLTASSFLLSRINQPLALFISRRFLRLRGPHGMINEVINTFWLIKQKTGGEIDISTKWFRESFIAFWLFFFFDIQLGRSGRIAFVQFVTLVKTIWQDGKERPIWSSSHLRVLIILKDIKIRKVATYDCWHNMFAGLISVRQSYESRDVCLVGSESYSRSLYDYSLSFLIRIETGSGEGRKRRLSAIKMLLWLSSCLRDLLFIDTPRIHCGFINHSNHWLMTLSSSIVDSFTWFQELFDLLYLRNETFDKRLDPEKDAK